MSPAPFDNVELDNSATTIVPPYSPSHFSPPSPSDTAHNDNSHVGDALGLVQLGEWFFPLTTSTPLESLSLATLPSVPSDSDQSHSPTPLALSKHLNATTSLHTDQSLDKDSPTTNELGNKRKRPASALSRTNETTEKRKSTCARNAVQFGVQTVANGARSLKAR
ncbi:hypothetical protein BJ165DRAFT_1519376, partial [Panaeolus papilionaceus]